VRAESGSAHEALSEAVDDSAATVDASTLVHSADHIRKPTMKNSVSSTRTERLLDSLWIYGSAVMGGALLGLFWGGNIGAAIGAAVGLFAASRYAPRIRR
jgi:hypothetical protein